ncbi:MAG: MarR family transcriptional regulator [Myxococcales bacterium]|nr:MarR family transcriptional regulator [Myxococcales bacterium]
MSNTVGIPEAGIELILELMQAPDGLKQRELGDILRLRNSTISVAIKRLLDADLIRRRPDADERAWRVSLKSDAPAKKLASQFEWYEESLTKKYTREELALVGRVLDDWIQLLKGDSWLPW